MQKERRLLAGPETAAQTPAYSRALALVLSVLEVLVVPVPLSWVLPALARRVKLPAIPMYQAGTDRLLVSLLSGLFRVEQESRPAAVRRRRHVHPPHLEEAVPMKVSADLQAALEHPKARTKDQ